MDVVHVTVPTVLRSITDIHSAHCAVGNSFIFKGYTAGVNLRQESSISVKLLTESVLVSLL